MHQRLPHGGCRPTHTLVKADTHNTHEIGWLLSSVRCTRVGTQSAERRQRTYVPGIGDIRRRRVVVIVAVFTAVAAGV